MGKFLVGFLSLSLCLPVVAKPKKVSDALKEKRQCLVGDSLGDMEESSEFSHKKKAKERRKLRLRKGLGHAVDLEVTEYTHRKTGTVYTLYNTFKDEDDGGNTIGWVEEKESNKLVTEIGDSEFYPCVMFKAGPTEACADVQDLASARECFRAVAYAEIDQYEAPNSLWLTSISSAFRFLGSLMNEAKADGEKFKAYREADYVATAMQHQDENHLFYYVLKNGKNVRPVLTLEQNSADISKDSYPKNSKRPLAWSLGLKRIPGWDYSGLRDIAEQQEE